MSKVEKNVKLTDKETKMALAGSFFGTLASSVTVLEKENEAFKKDVLILKMFNDSMQVDEAMNTPLEEAVYLLFKKTNGKELPEIVKAFEDKISFNEERIKDIRKVESMVRDNEDLLEFAISLFKVLLPNHE